MQRAVPADAWGVGGSGGWTTLEVRILNWRREEVAPAAACGPAHHHPCPTKPDSCFSPGGSRGGGEEEGYSALFFFARGMQRCGNKPPGRVLLWHTGLSIYEETASTWTVGIRNLGPPGHALRRGWSHLAVLNLACMCIIWGP